MSSPRRRVKRAISTVKQPVAMQSVVLPQSNKWLISSVTLSLILALLLFWKFAPANSAPKPSDTPVASVAVTSFTGEVANNFPFASSPRTPVDTADHGTVGNPTITSLPAHQNEAGVRWRSVVNKKIENGTVTLTLKDEQTGELSTMTQPLGTNVDVQERGSKASTLANTTASAKGELSTQGIETIKAGMTVPTRDPITGKTEFKKVVRTFKHTAYEIVKLELADGKTGKKVDTLQGTPLHPFFTPSGMVAMGDLKPEMKVITRRGPPLVVKSVTREPHPEGIAVYNFEVEGDHTYFVGKAEGGIWVHNDCLPKWLINAADKDGFVTIGRGMNPGETFGPGGISKSGWPAVHATTDLNMAKEIATGRGTSVATTRIHLTDLERLVNEGKIHLGHNMRELRMLNDHLDEIAGHLHQ